MKPIIPKEPLSLLAFVGKGKVHEQPPAPPQTFLEIYVRADNDLHRAAVTHSKEQNCFLTLDLNSARRSLASSRMLVVDRWWSSISKARAIAHALWFARD